MWLRLWYGPMATAPIRPIACEPPYAGGAALKKKKKKKKKKKRMIVYSFEEKKWLLSNNKTRKVLKQGHLRNNYKQKNVLNVLIKL